jgi:O-antigen/teichoic acid export membrane protein
MTFGKYAFNTISTFAFLAISGIFLVPLTMTYGVYGYIAGCAILAVVCTMSQYRNAWEARMLQEEANASRQDQER